MNRVPVFVKNKSFVFWVLIAFAAILYRNTIFNLFDLWASSGNPTYNHGLLLFPLCIGMLAFKWKRNQEVIGFHPTWSGFALLIFFSLFWAFAYLGNVQFLEHMTFIFVLASIVWAVFGFRFSGPLIFPILLLLMAITIWDVFSMFLQYATAYLVYVALNFSGIPVFLENNHLYIPAGIFHVEGGCSGLGQFMVAVIVALLYSNLAGLKTKISVLVVASSILISLISNTIRVYIVVAVGQATGMQHELVNNHYNLGWLVFGISISIFLFIVDRYLVKTKKGLSDTENSLKYVNSNDDGGKRRYSWKETAVISVLALLALGIGPALIVKYKNQLDSMSPLITGHGGEDALLESAEWELAESYKPDWQPVTRGSDLSKTLAYRSGSDAIVVYSRHIYRFQKQGKEAVQYGNNAYDTDIWRPVSRRTHNLCAIAGFWGGASETRIRSIYGDEKLVWQWYEVMGLAIKSGIIAKGLNVLGMLAGSPDISYVAIAIDLGVPDAGNALDDSSEERDILTGFYRKLICR